MRETLMKATLVALAAIGFVGWCCAASAGPQAIGFDGAKWIWFSSGADMPLASLPASVNYFRAELTLPEKAQVQSAEVIATCDQYGIAMVFTGMRHFKH